MAEIISRKWNYMTKTWNKYTKKQWDREIGWGTAPDKYKHESELTQSDYIDMMIKGHNS